MNKEKQRIKIAEACGWKDMFIENNRPLLGRHEPESMGRDYLCVPDYLNDLNAMHEALKELNEEHLLIFAQHLKSIAVKVFLYTCTVDEVWTSCFQLEAQHWAEAFLKTLNLWEQ